MNRLTHIIVLTALLTALPLAQAADDSPWFIVPDSPTLQPSQQRGFLSDRSPLVLPDESAPLSMSISLLGSQADNSAPEKNNSTFSWSLETWQMNTASLAHIQCSQGMLTANSYLAQDCRFVDQPLPGTAVNLFKISGDWLATPGLKLGVGAFRADDHIAPMERSSAIFSPGQSLLPARSVETSAGMDVNVSFGIQTQKVGDFLVGLQLARYRQHLSLADLGMPARMTDLSSSTAQPHYASSAQLMLGWRRGSFSGEMLGHHRDLPLWASPAAVPLTLSSFDLEFSWHPQNNSSLTIGVSNLMDAAPRADKKEPGPALEDPLESVYGRIPYVRYKQDL
ncbi:MAG TPA: hypothetical protein VK036_07815 [Wenzhouxiangella sp.]|nr:hypothetical protein [Wenzhouxiangella sp.]